MAITLVQFATSFPGTAASHTVTFGSAVTTGNSVVILTGSRFHVTGVSDNKGNTYTRDQIRAQDGASASIWRVSNCTGGSNFIVTFTMFAPADLDVVMQEIGCILTPLSGSTNTGIISSTGTTITPGGLLSHAMPVLSWGGNAMNLATSHAHAGADGYSNVGHQNNGMTSLDWAYDVFSSAGSRRPTWDCNVSGSIFAAAHQLYYEGVSASFTATPLSGTATLQVVFTDTSTGSPTSWFWQFGDGQLSTEQHPTVNFTIPGVYSPHLTVRRANVPDSTFQRTNYITVDDGGPPPPDPPPPDPPTPPGIPNPPPANPLSPTGPLATLPGSFAFLMANRPLPSRIAPSTASSPPGKPVLLPVVSGGSPARVERAGRTLSQVVNSLVQQKMIPRRGDDSFGLVTGGLSLTAAPGETLDVADGVRAGTFAVVANDDGTYSVYVNLTPDSGEAVWAELATEFSRNTEGGLSGTF